MAKIDAIKIVGVLEYPCVFSFVGCLYATEGIEYNWDKEVRTRAEISGETAQLFIDFFDNPRRVPGEQKTVKHPIGKEAVLFYPEPDQFFALTCIPSGVMGSKNRIRGKLMGRMSNANTWRAAKDLAYNAISRDIVVHGLPNVNKNIIAICDRAKARDGHLSMAEVATLKSCSHQIKSISNTRKILSPEWKPDGKYLPQHIHRHLVKMRAVSDFQLRERCVSVEISDCDTRLLMSAEDMDSLFYNVINNCAKYASRNSVVRVSFAELNGCFEISLSMNSVSISPDEVSRLPRYGFRTRRARDYTRDGRGLGLAIVDMIMRGYGGCFKVEPGVDVMGYADNRFILAFPTSLRR